MNKMSEEILHFYYNQCKLSCLAIQNEILWAEGVMGYGLTGVGWGE